jgi:uncharacterized protein
VTDTGKRKGEPGKVRTEPETTIVVHVQARASRTEIVGWHGDAIKIRVAAPPVDGAANTELVRFLARHLGLRQEHVRLAGGATGRRKRLEIAGMDHDAVMARLSIPGPTV